MRNARSARVGDTWHLANEQVEPLPEFQPALPKVFAGVYPAAADDFEQLQAAIVSARGTCEAFVPHTSYIVNALISTSRGSGIDSSE